MSSRKAFQPNSSNLIRTVSVELVLTLLIVIGLTGSIPPALASGGMPSDIFDLNSVAWASVRNYSSAAFSDYFDEMVDQGYMLIDYEVTAIDGQQRVSGVFQINVDGRAWVAFRNLTSDQFSEKWNQYKKAGYRLIEQDGYVLNGQLLYSLIMIENKEGLDWASRRNLTSAQFAEEFDVYKDRFIPVDVEAYPAGNATLYAITWVENVENLDWIERRNLTSAQFSEEFQQNKTNFRVHDIEAYVRDGNQNYAAIWIENKNGRAWKELRDMTVQQYADAWQANWDAGYRVTDFEVYDTPDGQKRYAAVWRQNTIRPGWQHKEDVDNLLEEAMEVFDIPGMSVAVAKGNTWLYLRGLGYADIDDGRKASSKTIYRLASVSKAVSGVMALDLEERGMIDLNEDTRTYVPTMPAHHTHEVWQTVTNRAGIGHYGAYDDFLLTMYEHFDTALEAAQLFWDEPLLYAPGTDTLYSTPAYTLFGAAVEGAVGDPIDTVVREELSERYNLPTLRAEDRSQANSNRASLYGWDEDLGQNFEWTDVDDTSQKVNGGGMEASAFDLARLGTKLLNGSILTEASLNTLWTPPDGLSNYAYGWEVAIQECSALVGKPGGQPGANAYLRIYPDFDITIVVLTNRWQGGHSAADISREIGQYMLEAECNAEPDVVQFRGIEHSSLGSARITPESGSLMVSNIGFRERDGVLIDLDASRSWQADMSFEYSPIGVAKFTAQADGRDLATLKLFEKDDALEIAPDFAGRDYQVMYLNGEETVGKTTRLAGTSAAHFNWDEIKCLLSGGESFICKLKVEYGPDQPGGGSAWSLALAEPVSMDLPGGPSFVDRIELIEALDGRADASEATRLTSMQLVFAHLNSVVIGDETVVADEDFVVYLPFVSRPPTHLFEEPDAPPTGIKLGWEGVDTPETVMEIGDESLHLTIENVDTVRLKARVTVEMSADGNRAHRLYESVSLEPGQKQNLELSLAAVDFDLHSSLPGDSKHGPR